MTHPDAGVGGHGGPPGTRGHCLATLQGAQCSGCLISSMSRGPEVEGGMLDKIAHIKLADLL